ncbi:MAG: GldG family protein [Oscillospiraceae bacterium]|jgi:hypothetical protein|nr:GldG family protein [Oscillospiraceae bacterium]
MKQNENKSVNQANEDKIALNPKKKMKFRNKMSFLYSKKFKYGSAATGITALFIVGIVIFNLIINVLSSKYKLSYDLTSEKFFQLTQDSIDFLSNLEKDIEIDMLNTEENFTSIQELGAHAHQANEVLKQYAKHSSHIKLNYIDVVKNPTYTNNYPKEDLHPNSIIVKSGEQYKVISPNDLFEFNSDFRHTKAIASKAEQAVTAAMLIVTLDNKTKITFLTGYGEDNDQDVSNLLENNGYKIEKINISTEEIPEDTNIVLVYGPERDYMPESLEKVEKFLSNGGQYGRNLIYAVNPKSKNLANLGGFLEKHGIKVGEGLIFETDLKKLSAERNPCLFLSDYGNSAYNLSKNIDILVCMPYSKPLEKVNDPDSNKFQVETLLQSSEKSGVFPDDASEEWKPTEDKFTGPLATSLASAFGSNEDKESKKSNIIVFGSSTAFNKNFTEKTFLNNSEFILNAFHILSGDEKPRINIEPKSLEGKELGISASSAKTIGNILYLILPSLILIIGLVIFSKRKNK